MAEEKKRKIDTNEERAYKILHDPDFWDDYKDDDEYEAKWSPKMEDWFDKLGTDEEYEYDEEEEGKE